ncbi:hypothetical protein D9M68_613230 [compost metagenome]
MHERAGFLFAEVGRGGAAHEERAVQVHVEHLPPFLFAHLVENAVAQIAGVIDHGVDAAIGVDCGLHAAAGAVVGGDAVGVGHCLPAGREDLPDDGLRRAFRAAFARERYADVVHDHLGAGLRHGQRDAAADAAARARNDHYLAGNDAAH